MTVNKRLLLGCTIALLVPLCAAQESQSVIARAQAARQTERQTAIQINQLAGNIHSPNDARNLVNMIAKQFADELPPGWVTAGIRDRIARAEYESVTSPSGLIPDQRIADAWNRYMDQIDAPSETCVTAAVIHNMRDADYATARVFWERGIQDIWNVPNIFAVGPNGKVANNGSTAIEAARIVYEIANQPENVRAARYRVQKGIVVSDWLKRSPAPGRTHGGVTLRVEPPSLVELAERKYAQNRGSAALGRAMIELIDNLLPEQSSK